MLAICLAAILSLPIYPLNPTEQDTVSNKNLHFTVGVTGPSGAISAGPELSVKYEYLFYHPFILRAAFDYRYGQIKSRVYPDGSVHRKIVSFEGIYYKGTNRLTAYIGIGLLAGFNSFLPDDDSFEELGLPPNSADIDMSWALGYKLTLGLRVKKNYSVEVGISESSPSFIYRENHSETSFTEERRKFRANDFKVSFGYLVPL